MNLEITSEWQCLNTFLLPTYVLTFNVGVSRYTGIDYNHDIQSNEYRYRVNLVHDNIPVLAITAIFKMNRLV